MAQTVCDIAVIGAGMAGASVAAQLAAEHSVVLLERESVAGAHSTGRSAASFLPSYGGDVVRRLTAASRPLFDARSAELGVELLRARQLLWLATDSDSEQSLRRTMRENPLLQSLTVPEALSLCPILKPGSVVAAALDSAAMSIDVSALHQAYLRTLKRRRGTTLLRAGVHDIRHTGSTWQLSAGDQVITCAKVVDAAGAWADDVARRAHVPRIGLRPKRRTAFISQPRHNGEVGEWPLVIDACERWYVIPENGLVLASPADETDSPPCDPRPDELAVAQAIEAINDATTLALRSVKRAWAGLRSFVSDRAPVVGAWSNHDEQFYFLAGQGGYGIQIAPALARVAADVVSNGTLSAESTSYGVPLERLAPDRLQ